MELFVSFGTFLLTQMYALVFVSLLIHYNVVNH